uniref:Uncharacterized protein n=1 Tax=Minutocellus polymorphus TaxID=265543 RepID=A0A7S0FV64_9STRA|mmetsp:Transcript_8895/g.14680  ORF Transcript_8895/g.14680 Transcript_8895/m.14680 type:complete len:215 (+) Transcript_8895:141-785(+)
MMRISSLLLRNGRSGRSPSTSSSWTTVTIAVESLVLGLLLLASMLFSCSRLVAPVDASAGNSPLTDIVPPPHTAESSSFVFVLAAAGAGFILFVFLLLRVQNTNEKEGLIDKCERKEKSSFLPTMAFNTTPDDPFSCAYESEITGDFSLVGYSDSSFEINMDMESIDRGDPSVKTERKRWWWENILDKEDPLLSRRTADLSVTSGTLEPDEFEW